MFSLALLVTHSPCRYGFEKYIPQMPANSYAWRAKGNVIIYHGGTYQVCMCVL